MGQEAGEDRAAARLGRIRGPVAPRRLGARTIAALTSNPGCGRRAVVDAAGVDKDLLAARVGYPAPFGQSEFAIARGNAFEKQVKADRCAGLVTLLRDQLGLDLADPAHVDLGAAGRGETPDTRHASARERLLAAAAPSGAVVFDHPLVRLDVAGRAVSLEPDVVVVEPGGRFHVVEIKSFPVIDGQADGEKVAAAAIQAAVYVLALRRLLGAGAVSHEVALVCPKDFSNVPVATTIDVRRQLLVLDHQLARLTRIDTLLDGLPDDLSLDLTADAAGQPAALAASLRRLAARYAPSCLSTCELAFFCRGEAAGRTAALGIGVREELGGVETVADVLGLADGHLVLGDEAADAGAMLRAAARVYAEALNGGADLPDRLRRSGRNPGSEAEALHSGSEAVRPGGAAAGWA
jgi:hypothetical protein